MRDHRLIDERSLAFDRLVAEKLRANPDLIRKAQAHLRRLLATCSTGVRPVLLEWERLLEGPRETLFAHLEATDEHAARLRQSSPFCGIITAEERNLILREFHARESSAA
jgi:hypothetical protein